MSLSETSSEKPPISIWKRSLVAVGIFVALLVVAGLVHTVRERDRVAQQLQKTLAHLDESDPGWQLDDLLDARPRPEAGKDSAAVIVRVAKLLGTRWPDHNADMRLVEMPPPPERLDDERLGLINQELERVQPALTLARPLADMPVGRHHLEIARNPVATLLRDQQDSRQVATLLRYDVLSLLHRRDLKQALRSCRGILNTGRSLGDEPIIISHLVRAACVAIALNTIERTLAMGEAPADELAELAKLLALEEQHPTMLVSLRGERALQHAIYTRLRNGTIPLAELDAMLAMDGGGRSWWQRLMGTSRFHVEKEHALTLDLMTRSIANAQLPPHEQPAAEKKLDEEVKKLHHSLARILLPAVAKSNEAFRRKLAQVRCMQALVAVERFRQATGRWPARLDEVAPKYLPAVPIDPFDGKPVRLKKLPDGVLLYSVGHDGTDNGGTIDRHIGQDLGYQLWDVKARHQPARRVVKPMPEGDPGAPGEP